MTKVAKNNDNLWAGLGLLAIALVTVGMACLSKMAQSYQTTVPLILEETDTDDWEELEDDLTEELTEEVVQEPVETPRFAPDEQDYGTSLHNLSNDLLQSVKTFSTIFVDKTRNARVFEAGSEEKMAVQEAFEQIKAVNQEAQSLVAPEGYEEVQAAFLEATDYYEEMTDAFTQAFEESSREKLDEGIELLDKANEKITEVTTMIEEIKANK